MILLTLWARTGVHVERTLMRMTPRTQQGTQGNTQPLIDPARRSPCGGERCLGTDAKRTPYRPHITLNHYTHAQHEPRPRSSHNRLREWGRACECDRNATALPSLSLDVAVASSSAPLILHVVLELAGLLQN